MKKVLKKAAAIRLVVFDVDGVLSDGKIFFDAHGVETKAFCAHDGIGIKMLQNAGIEVAFVTGRDSKIVSNRAAELGIKHAYQGYCEGKLAAYNAVKSDTGIEDQYIAVVGDDILDLPLIKRAGFGVTVPNAYEFVKEHADYVTKTKGGEGAAREVCDLILQAQHKLQDAISAYANV